MVQFNGRMPTSLHCPMPLAYLKDTFQTACLLPALGYLPNCSREFLIVFLMVLDGTCGNARKRVPHEPGVATFFEQSIIGGPPGQIDKTHECLGPVLMNIGPRPVLVLCPHAGIKFLSVFLSDEGIRSLEPGRVTRVYPS